MQLLHNHQSSMTQRQLSSINHLKHGRTYIASTRPHDGHGAKSTKSFARLTSALWYVVNHDSCINDLTCTQIWACIMFMCLELDRANISQAVTDNFLKDLKMNTNGKDDIPSKEEFADIQRFQLW